jgi:diguanylate cyclase (GGDEF)-like protein
VDGADSNAARARILVVDDVADNRDLIIRRFKRRGFDVLEAESGTEALERIDSVAFDAILLDVMMPGVDGMEVLRTIRAKHSAEVLPVIMVTATGDSPSVVKALELGANDYVTKPVDFAVTLARVNAQVGRKRANEELRRSNAALRESNERLATEVKNRRQAEAQTRYLSIHDALTGLGNRTLLHERLSQALLYAARRHHRLAVLFIGLDNFKIVNESLGHKAGDELLRLLGGRMRACVRASDIVARFGGDEFVIVLLDQPESEALVLNVVNKIRAAITDSIRLDGHVLRISGSIGVANFPADGDAPEALINKADRAMSLAKQIGPDSVRFYRPDFDESAYARFLMQKDLRDAIARDELILRFQPQVDLRTNRMFAVEALIRWRHPELGVLSPARFIPLAEETGSIVAIGDWTIRECCRQNKAWQDAGLPPISICVNVSARQFMEGALIASVVEALASSGLEARFLELELTESLIMQDFERAIATMKELEGLGVQLSIDDFGTGYSSLAALTNFPIGRLKIDKSFITNLQSNAKDRAVVGAVISLGQKLNLRVIAEGVETDEQVAFLRESNCDEIQGYHFSKPVAAADIERLLRSGR